MTSVSKPRIESLDLLKGLVMILMALDHVRDYFHAFSFDYEPTDPLHSTLPIFFTRWITHFCAPTFCFLAGVSAFLAGRKKTKGQLSSFLLKRGIWLVLIELTFVNFAWYFDVSFRNDAFAVIGALGISMMCLSLIIHLPRTLILIFSCIMIFGHNLLDGVHYPDNFLWSFLHEPGFFRYTDENNFIIVYPVVPWIGVMSLGYFYGNIFDKNYNAGRRRKELLITGISSVLLFFLFRWMNHYGDPVAWTDYNSFSQTIISFLNPSKYPPSMLYLLMTLGGTFIFLSLTENSKGKVVDFFSTFGRVPFFYYIIHLYAIHILALIVAQLSGYGWQAMLLSEWLSEVPALDGFGYSLPVVYLVWAGLIIMLYPFCKWFDKYKIQHREKWWLSYL